MEASEIKPETISVPEGQTTDLVNNKRSYSEISQDVNIEDESKNLQRIKDRNGNQVNLFPFDEIIMEKSEECSPEPKKQPKDIDNLKTNSCFVASNKSHKFISLKSRIEDFFLRRSCEEHMNSIKKDLKLTKPHSPTLQTKNRLRKECDICLDENAKKEKKSIPKPSFVFKKFDPNTITSNENRFENGRFKARKIPNYKTMEIKKSEKDCVIPIGFKLQTEKRLTQKNKENINIRAESLPKSLESNSIEKRIDLSHHEMKSFSRYSLIVNKENLS